MPTRNSWSSSSTSTCLPNLRHASPRRQSTQPAQPNRCSGDFRGGDVDSIQFFVRIGKVGLVSWVEQGTAPDRIIASGTRFMSSPAARSRPLCPYPQEMRYIGLAGGDLGAAANYTCVAP